MLLLAWLATFDVQCKNDCLPRGAFGRVTRASLVPRDNAELCSETLRPHHAIVPPSERLSGSLGQQEKGCWPVKQISRIICEVSTCRRPLRPQRDVLELSQHAFPPSLAQLICAISTNRSGLWRSCLRAVCRCERLVGPNHWALAVWAAVLDEPRPEGREPERWDQFGFDVAALTVKCKSGTAIFSAHPVIAWSVGCLGGAHQAVPSPLRGAVPLRRCHWPTRLCQPATAL